MARISESKHLALIDRAANVYYEKYRKQFDLLDKSTLAKVRDITPMDVFALGSQFEAFTTYKEMCEEDGNLNQLGRIPMIAFDVITVVYGTSIMPLLASVQPIEEERGLVYYKNVKAGITKGNMAAGETWIDPLTPQKTPQGYSGNVLQTNLGNTTAVAAGSTGTITGTLEAPVRTENVMFTIANDQAHYGQDDGKGNIVGPGINGTINYETGVVNLVLVGPIDAGNAVVATYQQNYETADDIPDIDIFFDSRPVVAEIFALKGTIGLFQNYALRKRFGISAEESLAQDLVGEINAEMGGALIKRMYNQGTVAPVDYYMKPGPGVSEWENQQAFKMKMAQVEANMVKTSGRGVVSVMAAGTDACAVMQTLPGFEKIADGNVSGPHVFGTLDGTTIIRVPDPRLMPSLEAMAIWKGPTPFEAAAAYCPYMPLVVTSTLNNIPNPLRQTRAAATWAAIDVLVPGFIGKLVMHNEQDPDSVVKTEQVTP